MVLRWLGIEVLLRLRHHGRLRLAGSVWGRCVRPMRPMLRPMRFVLVMIR